MEALYPWQKNVLPQIHNGCILCGGVGSGKSRAAIAYYFIHSGGQLDPFKPVSNPSIPIYIITTAKKRDSREWERDLASFLLYPAGSDLQESRYSPSIIIDSWNNISKYRKVYGAFFILDEQRVVGSGKWVKSFLDIARKNRWILLSATPGDTWSDYIPVFIANGYYKNRTEFLRTHAVYNRFSKYPKIDRWLYEDHLQELKNKVVVYMDYFPTTQRHNEIIKTEYDRGLYNEVVKNRWNPYLAAPIKNASELCQVLREIVNNDITKTIALEDICYAHPKVIVFYNFNYELEAIRDTAENLERVFAELNGKRHDPLPQTDEWIYAVQYFAGAEAWNCIETDTMVFYSDSYSWKQMEQAAGRIDRSNTPFSDLYYYHFVSEAGIDRAIQRSLRKKKDFNERSFVNNLEFA